MLLFATHNLRLRANTATTAPTADELLVLADGSVVNTTTGEVTTENPPLRNGPNQDRPRTEELDPLVAHSLWPVGHQFFLQQPVTRPASRAHPFHPPFAGRPSPQLALAQGLKQENCPLGAVSADFRERSTATFTNRPWWAPWCAGSGHRNGVSHVIGIGMSHDIGMA